MSSAQKLQSHPAVINAQDKASYYLSQLDKEVNHILNHFFSYH